MIPSLFYAVGLQKSLDVHLWYKKREKKTSGNQRKVIVLNSVFLYQLYARCCSNYGSICPIFSPQYKSKLLYFSLFNIQACPFFNLNQTSSAYTKHRTILHGNDCCCQKETETSKVHLNINCFDLCVYLRSSLHIVSYSSFY